MPGKKPPLKSAFDIPATEHPVPSPKTARREKPAHSSDAFANLIASPSRTLVFLTAVPAPHPLAPETLEPKGTQALIGPEISATGHGPGRRKTNMGRRSLSEACGPDLDRWVVNIAKKHNRRVGDIAAMACLYSFELVESGQLAIKNRPTPNGLTLFQNGDYNGFVFEPPASKKVKNKSKGKTKEEDWRFRTTTCRALIKD